MPKLDVVVVGELNADLVLSGLASLPEYGEVRLAKGMQFTLGSSSAIFACNLARLGASVGFAGKVGADLVGDYLLERLRASGVETSRIAQSSSGQTGICVILSFAHDYAIASYAGVRESFCLDDVDLSYVTAARHLHVSSYFLQPALQPGAGELFGAAKRGGLTTSLDPDYDTTGKWNGGIRAVLPAVDTFLPNGQEALHVSGALETGAALEVLSDWGNEVVIKRGADGVLTKWQGRAVAAPGFAVNAIDTTGAGDSFNAGFIYQRLRGGALWECVAWGNACGALSTRSLGGTEGFPTAEEVKQFLQERGEEVDRIRRAFAAD